jgi:regulatory protein
LRGFVPAPVRRHFRRERGVAVCGMANDPLSKAALHEAALAHLARYATTQAGLLRVLNRRIDRWVRAQAEEVEADTVAAARAAARAIGAKLAEQGLINDAEFAASRARSLTRAGRSRQAIAAHLAARGVDRAAAAGAMPEHEDAEFAAALACARRRRIGPFRRAEVDAEGHNRELAMLARAGFPRDVALRALACPADEAETLTIALRQNLLDPS